MATSNIDTVYAHLSDGKSINSVIAGEKYGINKKVFTKIIKKLNQEVELTVSNLNGKKTYVLADMAATVLTLRELVLQLLRDGQVVDPTVISQQRGCDRKSITKAITEIRSMGYNAITVVPADTIYEQVAGRPEVCYISGVVDPASVGMKLMVIDHILEDLRLNGQINLSDFKKYGVSKAGIQSRIRQLRVTYDMNILTLVDDSDTFYVLIDEE